MCNDSTQVDSGSFSSLNYQYRREAYRVHVGESKDASPCKSVRFHFSPNAFARVQLRTIAGQQVHAQLSLIAPNFLSDLTGLMGRMTIPNQKNGLRVFTPPFSIINRIRPRRFTTLSIFNRCRAPVLRTTGVFPLSPNWDPVNPGPEDSAWVDYEIQGFGCSCHLAHRPDKIRKLFLTPTTRYAA
jgi:hypothetical protein